VEDLLARRDNFDQICTNLLLSDADLALTFISIAEGATNLERKRVTIGHARHAYCHICQSLTIVRMRTADIAALGAKLESIKSALDEFDITDADRRRAITAPQM
jgi:hypothetical protein